MDCVQMVNNRNMLVASLLRLFLGATLVYADGAGIEGETLNQELLALCKTPEATPEAVETLLKADANVTARNERGKTVIDYAKKNENIYKTKAYWKLNDALCE